MLSGLDDGFRAPGQRPPRHCGKKGGEPRRRARSVEPRRCWRGYQGCATGRAHQRGVWTLRGHAKARGTQNEKKQRPVSILSNAIGEPAGNLQGGPQAELNGRIHWSSGRGRSAQIEILQVSSRFQLIRGALEGHATCIHDDGSVRMTQGDIDILLRDKK